MPPSLNGSGSRRIRTGCSSQRPCSQSYVNFTAWCSLGSFVGIRKAPGALFCEHSKTLTQSRREEAEEAGADSSIICKSHFTLLGRRPLEAGEDVVLGRNLQSVFEATHATRLDAELSLAVSCQRAPATAWPAPRRPQAAALGPPRRAATAFPKKAPQVNCKAKGIASNWMQQLRCACLNTAWRFQASFTAPLSGACEPWRVFRKNPSSDMGWLMACVVDTNDQGLPCKGTRNHWCLRLPEGMFSQGAQSDL